MVPDQFIYRFEGKGHVGARAVFDTEGKLKPPKPGDMIEFDGKKRRVVKVDIDVAGTGVACIVSLAN